MLVDILEQCNLITLARLWRQESALRYTSLGHVTELRAGKAKDSPGHRVDVARRIFAAGRSTERTL